AALRDAPGAGPRAAPDARLRALVRAYRAWAIAHPHRYGLLFGPPLPGDEAHSAPIVAAAQEAMAVLVDVVAAAGVRTGATPAPRSRLARQLQAWGRDRGTTTDPAVAMRAIAVWSRVHGHVALEIGGNFASMGLDAAALFEAEL